MFTKIKEFFKGVRARFNKAVTETADELPGDNAWAGFGMIACAATSIFIGAVISGVFGFLVAFTGGLFFLCVAFEYFGRPENARASEAYVRAQNMVVSVWNLIEGVLSAKQAFSR